MTIEKTATITCDGCGKQAPLNGFKGKWLSVQSMVSSTGELTELMETLGVVPQGAEGVSEEDMKKVVDSGDFCSLRCLGNWAGSVDALRGLDAELEGMSFLDTDFGKEGDEPAGV